MAKGKKKEKYDFDSDPNYQKLLKDIKKLIRNNLKNPQIKSKGKKFNKG